MLLNVTTFTLLNNIFNKVTMHVLKIINTDRFLVSASTWFLFHMLSLQRLGCSDDILK